MTTKKSSQPTKTRKISAEAPEPKRGNQRLQPQTEQRRGSHLEERFLRCWEAADGPELERELAFDEEAVREAVGEGGRKPRRWRADFAHRKSRTLIEIDGGVFSGGRHTRGRGFAEDCEKHLAAWRQGWTVIRLVEPQIRLHVIRSIVERLRAQSGGQDGGTERLGEKCGGGDSAGMAARWPGIGSLARFRERRGW